MSDFELYEQSLLIENNIRQLERRIQPVRKVSPESYSTTTYTGMSGTYYSKTTPQGGLSSFGDSLSGLGTALENRQTRSRIEEFEKRLLEIRIEQGGRNYFQKPP